MPSLTSPDARRTSLHLLGQAIEVSAEGHSVLAFFLPKVSLVTSTSPLTVTASPAWLTSTVTVTGVERPIGRSHCRGVDGSWTRP